MANKKPLFLNFYYCCFVVGYMSSFKLTPPIATTASITHVQQRGYRVIVGSLDQSQRD